MTPADKLLHGNADERRDAAFALARDGEARALWELFVATQDATFAAAAVTALQEVLQKSAGAASEFDLQAVAHLLAASQEHYYDDAIGSGGTVEGHHAVDCRVPRELARAELARRGIALSPVAPMAKILASREYDISFRLTAAYALGDSRDPRAFEPLVAALKKPGFVGVAGAAGLGRLGDARAIAPLTAAAQGSDKEVAKAAAASLKQLQAEKK